MKVLVLRQHMEYGTFIQKAGPFILRCGVLVYICTLDF